VVRGAAFVGVDHSSQVNRPTWPWRSGRYPQQQPVVSPFLPWCSRSRHKLLNGLVDPAAHSEDPAAADCTRPVDGEAHGVVPTAQAPRALGPPSPRLLQGSRIGGSPCKSPRSPSRVNVGREEIDFRRPGFQTSNSPTSGRRCVDSLRLGLDSLGGHGRDGGRSGHPPIVYAGRVFGLARAVTRLTTGIAQP